MPHYGDDRDEEDRSEMSGLRMSLLSIALAALLIAVLLTWHLLPVYYLWNYLAGVTIWLLATSVPVVALIALVSSVLDLMRVGGTDGEVAGKGSAVAGLILSILVLILCAVFILSFRETDSSQNEGASRPKEYSTAKTQSTQRKKTEATEFTENKEKHWNRRFTQMNTDTTKHTRGFCRGARPCAHQQFSVISVPSVAKEIFLSFPQESIAKTCVRKR